MPSHRMIKCGITLAFVVSGLLFVTNVVPVPRLKRATASTLNPSTSALQPAFFLFYLKITNRVFTSSLENPSSEDYGHLRKELENLLSEAYSPFPIYYKGVADMTFSNGSILAKAKLWFENKEWVNASALQSMFNLSAVPRNLSLTLMQVNPLEMLDLSRTSVSPDKATTPTHTGTHDSPISPHRRTGKTTALSNPGTTTRPHSVGPGTTTGPHSVGPGTTTRPHSVGPGTTTGPHSVGPGRTSPSHRTDTQRTSKSASPSGHKTTTVADTVKSTVHVITLPGGLTMAANSSRSTAVTQTPGDTTHHSNTTTHHSNATTAHSNATTHHSNTTTHPSNATTAHSNATTHHSNATTAHSNATTHHSNATTHHSNATTAHSNATTHPSNATTHHSNATTAHSNATTHPSNATTQPSNATTHTSNATTHHSNATTHHSNASTVTHAAVWLSSPVQATTEGSSSRSSHSTEASAGVHDGWDSGVPGWGIALLVLAAIILLLLLLLFLGVLVWWCCDIRGSPSHGQIQDSSIPLYATHGRYEGANGNTHAQIENPSKNRTGMYVVNP